MFDGLVAFFFFLTLIYLFLVITTIWLCYVTFRYYTHEDIDSSIAYDCDANIEAFEMEYIGNPNVEVKID